MKKFDKLYEKYLVENIPTDKKTIDRLTDNTWTVTLNGIEVSGNVMDLITTFDYLPSVKLPIEFFDTANFFNVDNIRTADGTNYKDLSAKKRHIIDMEVERSIMKSDLSYPIYVVLNDAANRVISVFDGNHRIAKAKRLNKKYILAKALSKQDVIDKFSDKLVN